MTLILTVITFCGVLVSARYSAGVYQCLENTAFVGSVECDTVLNILACVRRWYSEATSDAIKFQVSNRRCCHGNFGGIENDRLYQLNDSIVCYRASKINATIGSSETPTIFPATASTVTSPQSQSMASMTSTTSPTNASSTLTTSPPTATPTSTTSPTIATPTSATSPPTATLTSTTSPTTATPTSTSSPPKTTTISTTSPSTAKPTLTTSPLNATTTALSLLSITTAMTSTTTTPASTVVVNVGVSVPVTCEAEWTVIEARCFQFINTNLTWNAARTHCQNMGGDLAHVYTPGHITQFVQMLTCMQLDLECQHHLGINDIAVEGTLVGPLGQVVTADVNAFISGNNNPRDCSCLNGLAGVISFCACDHIDSFFCEKGPI